MRLSPHRGASFEAYLVEQIIQLINLRHKEVEIFYFRSSDGLEVDLLFKRGLDISLCEIKTNSKISKSDVKNVIKLQSLLNIKKATCLYFGESTFQLTESIEALSVNLWIKQGCPEFWV